MFVNVINAYLAVAICTPILTRELSFNIMLLCAKDFVPCANQGRE